MVEKQQTPKLGILVSDLNDQILDEILRIYYKVSIGTEEGPKFKDDWMAEGEREYYHQRTLEDLTQGRNSEWRLGSRWSGHSKFCVKLGWGEGRQRLVWFDCYDNLDRESAFKQQGRQMEEEFEKLVYEYLQAKDFSKPRIF